MPTLFAQFYAAAHTDLLVWGSLSCCCSILLLVTYYIFPDVRRTPGWQFLYSSLYDLYASAGFVAIALLGSPSASDAAIHLPLPPGLLPAGVAEDDPDVVEHAICAAYLPLFVSFLAADMGANCWRLLMYVDLIVVYHNPFRTTTGRPLYHIAVLLAAALWALALSDTSVLCTSSDGSGSLNLQTLTVSLVYAPFCLFVFGGGTLYSVVAWLLSHDKESRPISLLARQRVMEHCLLYLLLYGALLGALTASYANFRLFTEVGRGVFIRLVAALTAGRPVFAFLGWLLINRVPQRCGAKGRSRAPSSRAMARLSLAEPLVAGGGEGGKEAAGWGAAKAHVAEAGFKEELRYELVLDVTKAISELAERETRQSSQPEAPPAQASPTQASDGSAQAGGGPVSPERAAEVPLSHAALQQTPRRTLAFSHSLNPRVQHYAIAHFRAIRAAFGISPKAFAAAFASLLPELQHPSRRSYRLLGESVSEGASGSFFYWVKHTDGRDTGYIVKQVTRREKDALMHILPAYKQHVQARGGASLLRYLSCHSMRLRWPWAGKVYFVVMRNFFPAKPQLSFDLKGATANRRALKAWQLHQTNTVSNIYNTLRDWEWMDIGMATDLEPADRDELWSIISADTALLRRLSLLDYSLLLGIYRPPPTMLPQQKHAQLAELVRQSGGTAFISRDRQKVYFFGIIDVLEHFSLRWRLQRIVLRALYCLAMRHADSDGISAMPPPLYADRFQTFVANEVLHLRDPPQMAPVDEEWREGGWVALLKRLTGAYGAAGRGPRGSGLKRWNRLWERRRRGLVKQRIDAEHDDYVARIRELEEHIQILEGELGGARRREGGLPDAV